MLITDAMIKAAAAKLPGVERQAVVDALWAAMEAAGAKPEGWQEGRRRRECDAAERAARDAEGDRYWNRGEMGG